MPNSPAVLQDADILVMELPEARGEVMAQIALQTVAVSHDGGVGRENGGDLRIAGVEFFRR